MRLVRALKRGILTALAELSTDPHRRMALGGRFKAADIPWICETFFEKGTSPGSAWDAPRDAHLELPDWFVRDLDPRSEAYARQQERLWQLIAGVDRPYEAIVDEKEQAWGDVDAVRTPGYFVRRDQQAVSCASDHILAMGMILKHSGLKAGDWALEYGAGFGQTALALARLAVNVDTVDISPTFCEYVRRQAEFFQVPLNAFHGAFGMSPRPGHKYQLIWFYESFHHCLDFQHVVHQLREQLAEGGRIILGGEPIEVRQNAAVPYPWGLRLHSEVVAVVRRRHWFELGFSERFLFELFSNAGFVGCRIDCEPSLFGRLHVFERRPDEIHFGRHWLPTVVSEQWQSIDADGRWAGTNSSVAVDTGDGFSAIELDVGNPSGRSRRAEIAYGNERQTISLKAGARATMRFNASRGARELIVRCDPSPHAWVPWLRMPGVPALGILVRRLRYASKGPENAPSTAGANP